MAMVDSSRTGEDDDDVSLAAVMLRRLELQDQKIADQSAEVAALKEKADENAATLTAVAELWTQMSELWDQMAGMALRLRSDVRRS